MADKILYADDFTKHPYTAGNYSDMRGVVDFGNLVQFAPYESGYCFLAVINGPHCMTFKKDDGGVGTYNYQLQEAFISVLENEFKGLDGIEDITTETMDITDNISTLSLISKSVQNTNSQISMRFTEKTGSLLTKYCSTFIRMIKDTKTQAKTYGGLITKELLEEGTIDPGPQHEVFNMLYIVTDSTCMRIEKAFLILNAQPTTASYGELYQAEKGGIETKELTLPFNAFVVDGLAADKLASAYMTTLVNSTNEFKEGKINVNSWNFDWSFSNINGEIHKVSELNVNSANGKLAIGADGDVKVDEYTTADKGSMF